MKNCTRAVDRAMQAQRTLRRSLSQVHPLYVKSKLQKQTPNEVEGSLCVSVSVMSVLVVLMGILLSFLIGGLVFRKPT